LARNAHWNDLGSDYFAASDWGNAARYLSAAQLAFSDGKSPRNEYGRREALAMTADYLKARGE
jgi:hypothetical protein